jgi:hypothetical protein
MTKRNLTGDEHRYNVALDNIIQRSPKEFIVDAPMCFSNRVSVQNLVSRYELYKLVLDVPGDIIECGVYKGNSFTWMAHLSVILEPYCINRRFIGFDTFKGFSSIDSVRDPSDISQRNFADTSYEIISASLENIDQVRPVNKIKRFELVRGDIVETLPRYIASHPWMTCAMLILDTDLYAPTKAALEAVLPIMPKGGVLVFDEYNYQNFPGETQAIREVLKISDLRVKKFVYESCTAYAIIE